MNKYIKPKIFVAVSSSGFNKAEFTDCIVNLAVYFQSELLAPEVKEQYIRQQTCVSSNLCHNYHQLVLEAQKWEATHFLILETDMGFAPQVLHILFRKKQLWVGCNYPMKVDGNNWSFTAVTLDQSNRILTDEKSWGLEASSYTGFGVTLFDMEIFNKVSKPWFIAGWYDDDSYGTQDAWFGQKAREVEIIPFVDHDASKLIWHIGDKPFTWKECSKALKQKETNNVK